MHEEEIPNTKGPITIIGGIFLILLFLLWLIPAETVPLNPEPTRGLTLAQAVEGVSIAYIHDPTPVVLPEDYVSRVTLTPQLKTITDRVVLAGCGSDTICQAKAAFYFVRDELHYVKDPTSYEYVKGPLESLHSTGGDCDDASVLLASMLKSIGIPARFVFIPGHVYIEAMLPDAPKRYKQTDGWIVLDGTCPNCAFGELAQPYLNSEKRYVNA